MWDQTDWWVSLGMMAVVCSSGIHVFVYENTLTDILAFLSDWSSCSCSNWTLSFLRSGGWTTWPVSQCGLLSVLIWLLWPGHTTPFHGDGGGGHLSCGRGNQLRAAMECIVSHHMYVWTILSRTLWLIVCRSVCKDRPLWPARVVRIVCWGALLYGPSVQNNVQVCM